MGLLMGVLLRGGDGIGTVSHGSLGVERMVYIIT